MVMAYLPATRTLAFPFFALGMKGEADDKDRAI
jgi:hypothetical protein